MVDGIQVTFWTDDEGEARERVRSMFDILFEEVIKKRGKKPELGV